MNNKHSKDGKIIVYAKSKKSKKRNKNFYLMESTIEKIEKYATITNLHYNDFLEMVLEQAFEIMEFK